MKHKLQDFSKRVRAKGKHPKWKTNKSNQSFWKNINFEKKVWWTDKRHTLNENGCWTTTKSFQHADFDEEKKVSDTKPKDQPKSFHNVSGVQNPRIKRYRNFFLTLFSRDEGKKKRKKNSKTLFWLWGKKKVGWVGVYILLVQKNKVCLRNPLWEALFEENQISPQIKN